MYSVAPAPLGGTASPCGGPSAGSTAADVSWYFPPARWLITRRATVECSTRHGERRPRSWRRAQVRGRTGLHDGRNSRCFRGWPSAPAAAHSAPAARDVGEAWRTVPVRVGQPFLRDELAALPAAGARTQGLRARVDALAATPVAARGRDDEIAANIDALRSRMLIESGSFQVFCAPASDLPAVLPEIGRLRELTFRHAGEGTGSARDLDRFDETYQHLFVWDRSRRRLLAPIASARPTACAERCRRTVHAHALRLRRVAARADRPALELGRSFVQPEYQRDFSPLLLLWKGISRLVAQSGRYSRLFGVVSISDRYNSTSRQLLVKFLQTHGSTRTSAGWCARRIHQRRRLTRLWTRRPYEPRGCVVARSPHRAGWQGHPGPAAAGPEAQCEVAWLYRRSRLRQCARWTRACGSRETSSPTNSRRDT